MSVGDAGQEPVAELERVSYTYPGASAPALREVSLRIAPGEVVVLAGPSGSGKSTLLRAISGLVPHFHGGRFEGRVTVAGRDSRAHGPGELAAAVGSLFQDPETQIVMGTVRAELAFGLENRGFGAAAVARGVEETALALSIETLLERPTAELSGGELQRVALGAALASRPEVLVLDEPTSQLDPVVGDELLALLRRINEDAEVAIVLAEHRLERCLHAADRVVALGAGEIAFNGAPDAFLRWAGDVAPVLQTPGARLLRSAGLAPRAGVRRARAALRAADRLPAPGDGTTGAPAADAVGRGAMTRRWRRAGAAAEPALALDGLWHELREGPVLLRGVTLALSPGERVALMGRNGAGKSTLLRHAAGLMTPTRGSVRAAGRVGLLLQNPVDYLVHERVADEAPAPALEAVGLGDASFARRHPRELSGGERQRLALAVVLGEQSERPAVLCLDEPTRGMDRDHRGRLCALLRGLPGAALVATHDAEFAAEFADRVVLLAAGVVIADGPVREILSGGSYFVTETARILRGAGAALTPEQGAAMLRAPATARALA
jgi:energy-coupling factor transporter ATP-binding protein EcfA2